MNDYVDLADTTEIDEEDLSDVERAQAVAARDAGKTIIMFKLTLWMIFF